MRKPLHRETPLITCVNYTPKCTQYILLDWDWLVVEGTHVSPPNPNYEKIDSFLLKLLVLWHYKVVLIGYNYTKIQGKLYTNLHRNRKYTEN